MNKTKTKKHKMPKGLKAMTQEIIKAALQNLEDRLAVLEEMYRLEMCRLMFEPIKATKEQRQLEMWSE